MTILVFIFPSPALKTINYKIASFKRDSKDNREQSRHYPQNTGRNQSGLVPPIMVADLHGLFTTRRATTRGIAQIYFGLGVDGDAQRILASIRRSVDRFEGV